MGAGKKKGVMNEISENSDDSGGRNDRAVLQDRDAVVGTSSRKL